MNLLIRPVMLSDSEAINEMRRQEDVRANTFALATETIAFTEAFLKNMGGDDHIMVTELDGKAVGMVGIHLLKSARQRHTTCLGMMERTEYQGQGIGKKLLENKSLGFEVEGRKKFSIIKDGKYTDLLMMARYNIPSQFK